MGAKGAVENHLSRAQDAGKDRRAYTADLEGAVLPILRHAAQKRFYRRASSCRIFDDVRRAGIWGYGSCGNKQLEKPFEEA